MKTVTNQFLKHLHGYDKRKNDQVAQLRTMQYQSDHLHYNGKPIKATETATWQLCKTIGIPFGFFSKALTQNEREVIFNRLLSERKDEKRMFRFAGDQLYGVVSQNYRKMDNIILEDILRIAAMQGFQLAPVDYNLNPDHTKIRLVPDEIQSGELAPMIEFTNSENGLGYLQIWAGVYRWVCTNGLLIPVTGVQNFRWRHYGKEKISISEITAVLETSIAYMERLDRAKAVFLNFEQKMAIASNLQKKFGKSLVNRVSDKANNEYHGAQTLFDAINAITRAAQSFPASRQTEIELYASSLLAR